MSLERLFRVRNLYQLSICSSYTFQGETHWLRIYYNAAQLGTIEAAMFQVHALNKWNAMKQKRIYKNMTFGNYILKMTKFLIHLLHFSTKIENICLPSLVVLKSINFPLMHKITTIKQQCWQFIKLCKYYVFHETLDYTQAQNFHNFEHFYFSLRQHIFWPNTFDNTHYIHIIYSLK